MRIISVVIIENIYFEFNFFEKKNELKNSKVLVILIFA